MTLGKGDGRATDVFPIPTDKEVSVWVDKASVTVEEASMAAEEASAMAEEVSLPAGGASARAKEASAAVAGGAVAVGMAALFLLREPMAGGQDVVSNGRCKWFKVGD